MRIWSLHPKYLDAKGLVALWRETLLARKVLENKTIGYKNHPQLERFKMQTNPIDAINYYLKFVWIEANKRKYNFDKQKLVDLNDKFIINVTSGQVAYEKNHLLNKLKIRDEVKFGILQKINDLEVHPIFKIIEGEIEKWEKR